MPVTKDIGKGVEVSITLPQGWSGDPRGGYVCGATCDGPAGAGIIAFNDREYFAYGDPCRWSTSKPKAHATAAEALVEQLAKQTRRVVSGPESVTVDGRNGRKIILKKAEDVKAEGDVFPGCDDDKFALRGVEGEDPGRWGTGVHDVRGHSVSRSAHRSGIHRQRPCPSNGTVHGFVTSRRRGVLRLGTCTSAGDSARWRAR